MNRRMDTLVDIAKKEANIGTEEGNRVKNIFTNLPTGYSPNQIAALMNAFANTKRAQALLKLVEEADGSKISWGVANLGGENPTIATPAQQ
jgi:hypothetical protein